MPFTQKNLQAIAVHVYITNNSLYFRCQVVPVVAAAAAVAVENPASCTRQSFLNSRRNTGQRTVWNGLSMLLREAATKISFFLVGPIRGRGGKGQTKMNLFEDRKKNSDKNVNTKLEGGWGGRLGP